MLRKLSMVIILLLGFSIVPVQNSASADAKVYNSSGQFVGILVSVEVPRIWVVYNPELDRLIRIEPTMGHIPSSDSDACPYYDNSSSCNSDPFLKLGWGTWLIFCNNRYFMATTFDANQLEMLEDPGTYQLYSDGSCHSDPSSVIDVFPAKEITSDDLPFEQVYGPLHIEYTPSGGNVMLPSVQEVPAPAITPNGIILLAGLLGGVGYLAIRRRNSQTKS